MDSKGFFIHVSTIQMPPLASGRPMGQIFFKPHSHLKESIIATGHTNLRRVKALAFCYCPEPQPENQFAIIQFQILFGFIPGDRIVCS